MNNNILKKLSILILTLAITVSLLGYGTVAYAEEVSDEISVAEEIVEVSDSGEGVLVSSEEVAEAFDSEEEELLSSAETEDTTTEQITTQEETTEAVTEALQEETTSAKKEDAKVDLSKAPSVKTKVEPAEQAKTESNTKTNKTQTTVSKPKVALTVPALKDCASAGDGVKISWNAVEGAESYDIYWWSSPKKQWIKFANTKGTSYVDKTAKVGKKYYYTVAAREGNRVGKYDHDGKIGVFLKGAKLKITRGKNDTAELSWPKVEGADGYRIYWRYPGDKKWKGFKWITDNKYSDRSVKAGVSYEYLIRAYKTYGKTDYMGYYQDTYKAGFTLLEKPLLKTTSSGKNGVSIAWDTVKGAKTYNIYWWNPKKKQYIKFASSNTTSYLDKTAKAGKGYYYTVTAVDAYGNEGHYEYDGIIGAYVPALKITTIANVADGVKVTWPKSDVADGYRVYYRKPGGKWSICKDVENGDTYYVNNSGDSGTVYEYLVRPYRKIKGKIYLGFYDKTYLQKILKLDTPSVSIAKQGETSFKISWKAVKGAKKYKVLRLIKGEKWVQIAETTSLTYEDKKIIKGVDYYYTVKAVNGNTLSGYRSSARIKIPTAYDLPDKRYLDLGWNVDPQNSWGPADYCKGTSKVDTKYWTYHNTYKGDTYKPKAGDIITYGVPDDKGVTQGHVDICVKDYDAATGQFGVVSGNWGYDFTTSHISYVNKSWKTFTNDKNYYRTICNIWECKLPADKKNAFIRTVNGMKSAYDDNPSLIRGKILECKYTNWCDVFVAYAIYVTK